MGTNWVFLTPNLDLRSNHLSDQSEEWHSYQHHPPKNEINKIKLIIGSISKEKKSEIKNSYAPLTYLVPSIGSGVALSFQD